MSTPYDTLDNELEKLKPAVIALLNNLRLRAMEGRDVRHLKRQVMNIFDEIDSRAKKLFQKVANEYYSVTFKDIDQWLEEYNEVTQYVYKNEWERKTARYFEILLTFRNTGKSFSSSEMMNAQKRAADLIFLQIDEYGVFSVDKARELSFKKDGIKRLKWNTQKDKHVCEVCRSRNGKIYDIKNAPGKAHYRCRCYYSEVKE